MSGMTPMIQTMSALLHSMDLLTGIVAGTTTSEDLGVAISDHLTKHQAHYGTVLWAPKFHYALHLGDMLGRFGTILTTFTQERKHKRINKFADPREKTTSMEKGMIEDITVQHLHDLQTAIVKKAAVIRDPHNASQAVASAISEALGLVPNTNVLKSVMIIANGNPIARGDVVLYR